MHRLRWIFVVTLASGLVLPASPGWAQAPAPPPSPTALTMQRTPIGGAPGTRVDVNGTCGGTVGTASMTRESYSDAIPPPGDVESFSVRSDHTFAVTLTNPYGLDSGGSGPVTDARVNVACGGQYASLPFHASTTPLGATPTVFAALGDGPCGYGLAPTEAEAFMPCPAHIKGFTSTGSLARSNFNENGWPQGASIAAGDVTGDGVLDLIVGTGPGVPAGFALANLEGATAAGVATFGDFRGGAFVAVGDVTGDGRKDVVVGAGPGGGPHVKVFSTAEFGWPYEVGSFMAYAPWFRGGISVAAADVDGDGVAEIITGAGSGGGPHVRVFDQSGNDKGGFFAYAPNFTGGVNVAAGNLAGDGTSEIVTGAGPGGGPHVRVLDKNGHEISGFYAYQETFAGGVFVAVGRALGGASNHIVTGPGAGGLTHVRVTDMQGGWVTDPSPAGFFTFGPFEAGVRVAVAP